MARNSACEQHPDAGAVKNASTRNSAACTGLRAVMTRSAGEEQDRREDVEQCSRIHV